MCDACILHTYTMHIHVQVNAVEEKLHKESKLIPKTLVMLFVNPPANVQPSGTRKWIENRVGVHRHVHVSTCWFINLPDDPMI
jgi:hypothetical protein